MYPEEQPQRVEVNTYAPSARPNHKRSKNFSDVEDELLVSAWLNISLDPIIGYNQTRSSYWTRIYDYFHANKTFSSTRSQNSIMHRWASIQEGVNRFTGCLAQVERRRQSCATMQDKVMICFAQPSHIVYICVLHKLIFSSCYVQLTQACALYKSEDKQHKAFPYMHCWNKLRTQRKWEMKLEELAVGKSSNKKQKMNSNETSPPHLPSVTETSGPTTPNETVTTRPPGKKKAKAAAFQAEKKGYTETLNKLFEKKKETDEFKEMKKDERFRLALAVEQERAANEKLNMQLRSKELELRQQEVEQHKKREEERIMTLDLSVMPADQKQYYMRLRSKILSENA